MATSHFCKDKWRDGPVAECPRHQKLSKAQSNVYRGVGEPGGRNGAKAPVKDGVKSKPAKAAPAPKATPKASSSGSSD